MITLGTSSQTLQKGTYTITYRVKADNFGSTSYNGDYLKNFIKFGDDVEGTSTSIKTKDIEKSGKLSKDGEIITWTVKINNGDVMRYLPIRSTQIRNLLPVLSRSQRPMQTATRPSPQHQMSTTAQTRPSPTSLRKASTSMRSPTRQGSQKLSL